MTTLTGLLTSQYLDLCALHEVNLALNFDTEDSAIIGGCDMYTTKAAGDDKKLYKRIEQTLEDRHKQMLELMEKLPAQSLAEFADEFNTERNTPFGSFKEPGNRHKFAYFIATLNATHVDYDFANTLNPDEFRRENKANFTSKIDQTMYYLRPRIYSQSLPSGAVTPLGTPIWSQRSWQAIDSEIGMNDCEYYIWEPVDDPFADDGAIWSHHHFLYNKERKRVAYFYLRGVSALSSSPTYATSLMTRFKQSQYEMSPNKASRKRAEYWLGDRAKSGLKAYGESDELDDMVIDHPGEVVDREELVSLRDREASLDVEWQSDDDSEVEWLREQEESGVRRMSGTLDKGKSVRRMSESIASRMEL